MGSDPIMSVSLTLFGFGEVGEGASCGHGRGGARGRGRLRLRPGRSQPETKIASCRQVLVQRSNGAACPLIRSAGEGSFRVA